MALTSRTSPLPGNSRTTGYGLFLLALMLLAFALSAARIAGKADTPDFAFAKQAPNTIGAASTAATQTPSSPIANETAAAEQAALVPPAAAAGPIPLEFDANFVSSAPGQAVHAASAVELANGDLRAVWFSGSREGAGDVTIQTAVLPAGGTQWSPEKTLFERHAIERGLWRYVKKIGNPVIARTADGSLALWMVNVSLGGWAGSSISWARSTDEGETWSAPRRLVTSPFINISTLVKGSPLLYANGDVGLPVYHEFVAKMGEVLRLDQHGKVQDKIRIDNSQSSLQPVVLVTGRTTAEAFMRSGPAIALMASTTSDAGMNWSPTAPSRLPNPDAAVAGLVTQDGRRWLALNPTQDNRETLALAEARPGAAFTAASLRTVEASPTPRVRLPLADYDALLSRELKAAGASDEATKAYVASARRQLCGAERCAQEFSYPYLLQGRDGALHLVYTWHRSRIKHMRLDPYQKALTAHAAAAN